MKLYVLRRSALLVPLLLGITFITFTLTKSLPGDPVYTLAGERASTETVEKIRKEIGSDKGLASQYAGYISLLARGEMGRSYYTNRKVADDLRGKFPHTLVLALSAVLMAFPLGVLLGFTAALRRNGIADRLISAVSVAGLSTPVFWSGLMLMLLFSLRLKLFPPSGTGGLRYLFLPSLTLALPAAATLSRVTRVTVLDIMGTAYIRTARAKGMKMAKINIVHVMKNALIPIITVTGLDLGSYLNGAVLTETIFGWDGIGRYAMEGIMKRDYPVIMGCIVVGTVVVVLINFLVDLLYFLVDPRVRVHGSDR